MNQLFAWNWPPVTNCAGQVCWTVHWQTGTYSREPTLSLRCFLSCFSVFLLLVSSSFRSWFFFFNRCFARFNCNVQLMLQSFSRARKVSILYQSHDRTTSEIQSNHQKIISYQRAACGGFIFHIAVIQV